MTFYERIGRRSRRTAENETIEFRIVFALCFVVFLAEAALRRLTAHRRPAFYDDKVSGKSLIAEAREDASVCVTSAFMGW